MFWLLLSLLLPPLIYIYILKPHQYWKTVGVKQASKIPVPIAGDSWGLLSGKLGLHELVDKLYYSVKNTRYIGFYQFFLPTVLIKDPELIKQVLVKDFDHFQNHRPFIPVESDPLWGKNLFQLQDKQWRDMRSVVSPTFTSLKMKTIFGLMNEVAQDFCQHFLKKNQDRFELQMKDVFTRLTNDVIATTAFGLKVDSLGNPDNEFYLMGKEMTDFSSFWKAFGIMIHILLPKLKNILKPKMFSPKVSEYFRSLISDTIRIREEKGIVRPDLIHILMEARKTEKIEITDEDITAQAITFFFAGFDSVSGLMCFTAYELAVNPDCQEKLREEVLNIEGELTYEGLNQLKYMDMVLSESLRKWPNSSATDRLCNKPYTIEPTTSQEKPVHIKKDHHIWIPIYSIQRDPKYFPDPEKFDPERFSEENKDKIVPYSYLPFGSGPRICIGNRFALMEVKAVMFHILRNFRFVTIEKTQIPLRLTKGVAGLQAVDGIWLGLEKL